MTLLNRFYLDRKQVKCQIPDPPNKTKRKSGKLRFLDRETCNVERLFGRPENGTIPARHERMLQTFLALIHLPCIRILCRRLKWVLVDGPRGLLQRF